MSQVNEVSSEIKRAREVMYSAKNMPLPIDSSMVYVEEAVNLLNRLKYERCVDIWAVMTEVELLSNRIEKVITDSPPEILRIADIIRMAKSMKTSIDISRPFVEEAISYSHILFNEKSEDIRADTISRMELLAQNIQLHSIL